MITLDTQLKTALFGHDGYVKHRARLILLVNKYDIKIII